MADGTLIRGKKKQPKSSAEIERYYLATQWQLMWRKFRSHKLAMVGATILIIFYIAAAFCEFFATQAIDERHSDYVHIAPQKIHFFDSEGKFHLRPFVYGLKRTRDPETYERIYTEDTTQIYPIYFIVKGDPYKMWGLFRADRHLFGVREGEFFVFGTDELGRDMYSRIIYGARISLSIGLIGVAMSFVLGCVLGGISGYYGGRIDMFIQRIIDFLISIPVIPLWMALSAALPIHWPPLRIYFFITIILSSIGWCRLARVVRGKLIAIREEDFVMAAKISGMSQWRIIYRHLLPSFLSYLIVSLTLAIPYMILGETSLSFLGLGLRAPVVSWGVLLKRAQNFRTVAFYPWLLIPGIFVVIVVLAFNFLGDGLRDAADPYK
jgi:peptide/nickel transport system permease protein